MENHIAEQVITQTLETNYMPYVMSVIVSRAIPEIDGFKPAHRKLLYTMYKMGLLTGGRTKSANIVGQTMRLNPHGDGPIYETLVRLTRGNQALLHPFIDSKGNFGKQYSRDMAYAASRYTECKLDSISAEIFRDIDKNTVDMVDNYDQTTTEPTLLPTAFPNILVNPNTGIAVGMASSIASFNLGEVCDVTIAYIKNPAIKISDYLKAPDFSTGGKITWSGNAMEDIINTGRGSVKLMAKYRYVKKTNCIEIFEIPYTTTCEAIIDKIVDLIKTSKVKEISDVRDETDLHGLKIAIDLKRGVDPEKLMLMLYSKTSLMDTFSCNFNILVDGYPRVMGIKEILEQWIIFRVGCVKRRLLFDREKKDKRLHLLLGLKEILLDIDKAIRIIRHTKNDENVIRNLCEGFSIDRVQAEFIAEIKLRNLNEKYLLDRINEVEALKSDIAKIDDTLQDQNKVKKIITKELAEIKKKYAIERKTQIMEESLPVYSEDTHINDYNVKLFLTDHGYFKKIPLTSLRVASDQKTKDDDKIILEIDASNKDELILISDRQNAYKMKLYEISDTKASALGDFLPNLLDLPEGESILYATTTSDYSGFFIFAFDTGKIAKVALESYKTKTNRKKLANAYYGNANLVHVEYLSEDCDMAAFSSLGKVLVFNTSKIALKTTRTNMGVAVLLSKKNSTLTKVCLLSQANLTNPDYYRTQNIPANGYYLLSPSPIK